MNCERVEELLEAYVLGTLDPEETQAVAVHLADCARCRALAQEYAEVVAILPEALAAVSPAQLPASLKLRLLQKLEDGTARSAAAAQNVPLSDGRQDGSRYAFLQTRMAGGRRLRLALIAATLLLILSVVWSIHLNVVLARERALRAEFAELIDRQEVVLEVIDSNQTERRVLRSTDVDSRAYGKLFTRADMPHVVAMAARLDPPPPGQGYHLWVTNEGETTLAGVLNVNDEGFGLILFDADRNGPTYEVAEVTLQPVGTDAASGPVILRWNAES